MVYSRDVGIPRGVVPGFVLTAYLAAFIPIGIVSAGCEGGVQTPWFRSGDMQHLSDPEAPCEEALNAFLFQLNTASDWSRDAQVDSFLVSHGPFPIIAPNGSSVCFVYRGHAQSVGVAGDFNSWTPDRSPMRRIEETDLWLLDATFGPNARIEYKFVVDEASWILDPLNPRHSEGGFGANSELAMPGYVEAWEVMPNPNVPHGALTAFSLTSATLGQVRPYLVYTPAGYDARSTDRLPLLLFHDGNDYLQFGSARTILDNLIAAGRIEPLIAVFVPPVDRNDEYAFDRTGAYDAFIVDELLPAIETRFRTETDPLRRAMTGPSLGGLVTTRLCYARPDLFGLCAPISPAYWPNDGAMMTAVVDGPVKPIRWYIDWGVYEIADRQDPSTPHPQSAPHMRDLLLQAGYEVYWNEWPEGHSWGSWRANLDAMLETFFPGNALTP